MRETSANTRAIGTRDDRAALFDWIVEKTKQRQALSPAKNAAFGIDIDADMGRFREEMLDAETAKALWYALVKISNTRHDRHLSVDQVAGGLELPSDMLAHMPAGMTIRESEKFQQLPVRFGVDFSSEKPFLFLAAIDQDLQQRNTGLLPEIGSRLVSINGVEVDAYVEAIAPYFCYSTKTFFWYHLPDELVHKTAYLPQKFYKDITSLIFEAEDENIALLVPYMSAQDLNFERYDVRYEGWEELLSTPSFILRKSAAETVISLEWLWFGPSLVRDVDRLMAFAEAYDLLRLPLIFDATRSRGGDFGGYLLQRLAKAPFKINKGNLRISDATPEIVKTILAEDAAAKAGGDLNPDQLNAIEWRKEWFGSQISEAIEAQIFETKPVPFKCAHLPHTAEAILQHAEVHFEGPIACLSMPFGGSHIDQVVAQIKDNNLGNIIGMPLGGFSKTWTHEEVLKFERTGQAVVQFSWSCGNTFRPNGEVLESNPALPDHPLPITRDNFKTHHSELLAAAIAHVLGR